MQIDFFFLYLINYGREKKFEKFLYSQINLITPFSFSELKGLWKQILFCSTSLNYLLTF